LLTESDFAAPTTSTAVTPNATLAAVSAARNRVTHRHLSVD
jgi:hypothetical protein